MLIALRRRLRRLRLAYQLRCAREDARALGLRAPDGVWSCGPCHTVFLDNLEYVVHLHGA